MTTNEQKELVQSVYEHASQLKQEGKSDWEIEESLVSYGLEKETAITVVRNLNVMQHEAGQEDGRKNMLYGALWCIGGIIITGLTYAAASDGGSYVVTWGAIVFGAFQFIKGLVQKSSN